jgi:erythronate-4-phosphate dehydrogenase
MPLVAELFAQFADIQLLAGRDIKRQHLMDADVLLVRSVTRVDRALLEGTKIKFVGSATIGTDHIDLDYLRQEAVQFAHAPGCNAEAVVQYDLSVICRLMPEWQSKTVGIIGCGNVGGRLYSKLCELNVDCLVYDPFLSPTAIADLAELDRVLGCDIICLHTPLTRSGPFPTYHLLDASRLAAIGPDALIINAGRGEVVDNRALLELFQNGAEFKVALDVWENEPGIDTGLMGFVSLATPHIAGYSLEGKVNGTEMVFDAFKQWSGLTANKASKTVYKAPLLLQPTSVNQAILECYDVADDHQRMLSAMAEAGSDQARVAQAFDQLRKDYPVRREFSYYGIERTTEENLAQYHSLGFAIV